MNHGQLFPCGQNGYLIRCARRGTPGLRLLLLCGLADLVMDMVSASFLMKNALMMLRKTGMRYYICQPYRRGLEQACCVQQH